MIENGQPKTSNSTNSHNNIYNKIIYSSGIGVLIVSLLAYLINFSFLLGFFVGVISLLIFGIIFLSKYLGLNFDKKTLLPSTVPPQRSNPVPTAFYTDDDVADEENKNDIRILYKSKIINSHKNKFDLNNLYVDQNLYCQCKLNPENFDMILNAKIQTINKFTITTVKLF
jgi:hypothetical protein